MDTSDLDYPANTSTPGMLMPGGTDYGVISTVGDADWFRISLGAGQQYRFTIEGGTVNGLFDSQLDLYNAAGALVIHATTGQGFQTKYIDFMSPDSADYFLGASGGALTGSYSLRSTGPAVVPGSILGTAGNDFLGGMAGNDVFNGAGGTDTVRYWGARSAFNLSRDSAGTWTVRDLGGTEGTDTLTGVERLQFADTKVALDLSAAASAGKTAQIITAAFGRATLANKQYVGIGLTFFDAGATMQQLAQMCVGTGAVSAPDNTSFVRAVWQNVVGTPIDAGNLAAYVGLLDNNTFTQAGLLAVAAQAPANLAQIELTGLAATGIEYV